jgi:hypothetical protein
MESPGTVAVDAPQAVATAQAGTVACSCERCAGPLTSKRQTRFCSQRCRSAWWDEQHPRVSPTHEARKRAGSLKVALFDLMVDGLFRTVQQLAEGTGGLPATVSARLRPTSDLSAYATERGYRILRDHLVGNGHTPHRYQLVKIEEAGA